MVVLIVLVVIILLVAGATLVFWNRNTPLVIPEVQSRLAVLDNALGSGFYDPAFHPYMTSLHQRLSDIQIISDTTSYTVDKQRIALCLSSDNQMHSTNLVMYVLLHELAHIACPEVGHTPLFRDIFVALLQTSVAIGIYTPVNYQAAPERYCGMVLYDNLLQLP